MGGVLSIVKGLAEIKVLPMNKIAGYLDNIANKNDVILVLGAGNINEIIPDIKRFLERKSQVQRAAL